MFISAPTYFSTDWDIKALIPDANQRRRMSNVVRMGVATGLQCLRANNIDSPDAIITATSLGCIADSEKFLRSAIESDELNLPPTPFIQSTFNTIGSYIAIATASKGYNMTFVNRANSLADALLAAALQLRSGATNVLFGVFDETTPSVDAILQRMNIKERANSSLFCVLSKEKTPASIAQIVDLQLSPAPNTQLYSNFNFQPGKHQLGNVCFGFVSF